jgi:hypothetical protein
VEQLGVSFYERTFWRRTAGEIEKVEPLPVEFT